MRKRIVAGCAGLLVLLAAVSIAAAQNGSSVSGYAGVAGSVQRPLARSESPPPRTLDWLPFTGQDLALIVGTGLLLLAVGIGLRRLTGRGPRTGS